MGKKIEIFRSYQGNTSWKEGHNKGQKWYGPNRSRRYFEEVGRIHRRTIQKKKDLSDSNSHNGVIIHLDPDILECLVQWSLGSITANKASGGDGIPAELFQILKDDAVKVLHSVCQQTWKTQQWPQDWKRSVFIPISKKGNAKNVQTTTQLHSFHMLARSCSKSSKPGFNSM